MEEKEIRGFFDCHARPIKLDVSLAAFPKGLFPKQEWIHPGGRHIILIGIDGDGSIWHVNFDRDGLYCYSDLRSKDDFIGKGWSLA